MKKRLFAAILCVLLMSVICACGASKPDEDRESEDKSTKEAQELRQLRDAIEELQEENEKLSRKQTSVELLGQDQWEDDYIIAFTDKDMVEDVKELTGVKDRDITYGDVKKITEFVHDCTKYNDFMPLRYFTSLEKLKIYGCDDESELTGIENLGNLDKLKTLDIFHCDLSDLSFLKYTRNVEDLEIFSCDIENSDDLQFLTGLKELYWSNAGNPNMNVVNNLENLKVLDVGGVGADENVKLEHKLSDFLPKNNLSNLNEEELKELLAKLQEENEELRENIEKNPISDKTEEEPWADDYIITFLNWKLERDLREVTGITERKITYGDVKYITKYSLEEVQAVNDFQYLTGLRELEIDAADSVVKNIEGLANLKNLKKLVITGGCATDLTPLSGLTNLEVLHIERGEFIEDLNALSNLTNLKKLYIGFFENLEDIYGLCNLTNLTELEIVRCSKFTSLDALINLTNLTKVDISWCDRLTSIDALANLENLTTLHIVGCDAINVAGLYGLENLRNLTELDLGLTVNLNKISIYSVDELKAFLENRSAYRVDGCNDLFTDEEIELIVASMEELIQKKLTNVTVTVGSDVEYYKKIDGVFVSSKENNGGAPLVYVTIESDQGVFDGYADITAAVIVTYVG